MIGLKEKLRPATKQVRETDEAVAVASERQQQRLKLLKGQVAIIFLHLVSKQVWKKKSGNLSSILR